jgi:hypothetical protein
VRPTETDLGSNLIVVQWLEPTSSVLRTKEMLQAMVRIVAQCRGARRTRQSRTLGLAAVARCIGALEAASSIYRTAAGWSCLLWRSRRLACRGHAQDPFSELSRRRVVSWRVVWCRVVSCVCVVLSLSLSVCLCVCACLHVCATCVRACVRVCMRASSPRHVVAAGADVPSPDP